MPDYDKETRTMKALTNQMNSGSGSMLSSLTRAPLAPVAATGPTPAQPRSLAQMAMPRTVQANRSFAPDIRAAYQKGGAGAAVGQAVRGAANVITAPVADTAGAISNLAALANEHIQQPASRATSQAIKTAFTGDASPIAAAETSPTPPPTVAAPAPVVTSPMVAAPAATAPTVGPAVTNLENFMQMGGKTVNFGATPAATAGAAPVQEAPKTLDQFRQQAPRVVSVDITPVEQPKVRAGGMISEQVANLLNQRNARNAEARADQNAQAAVTADNAAQAPMRSALAQMAMQANDPLRALDAAAKKQDIEKGKLSLADQNRIAELKATMADPNATQEIRQAAAQALRQLAGKENEVKVATEQGTDGQRVSYVINADGSAVPVAEAAKATKERALQKTATKQIPQGHTKASLLSWAKQQLEWQKDDPRIKEKLTNELAAYGIAF